MLVGTAGDDVIFGGNGYDRIAGGPGFDWIDAGLKNDTCTPGPEGAVILSCETVLSP